MFDELINVLRTTLSDNNDLRKQAEAQIYQYQHDPQYGMVLIQIINAGNSEPAVLLAAATAFKNYIKIVWGDERDIQLDANESANIRSGSYNAMLRAPAQIAKHFCTAVCIISKSDFPSAWPDLFEQMGRDLLANGENFDTLISILTTIDEITKKYRNELRSVPLWKEIKLVLTCVAEPLRILAVRYTGALAGLDPTVRKPVLELTRLVVRIFHNLISQDLPDEIESTFAEWITAFNVVWDLREVNDDAADSLLDLVWMELADVTTLLAQRFEDVVGEYIETIVEKVWKLLCETSATVLRAHFTKSSLMLLSELCLRSTYSHMFSTDQIMAQMISNVVLPNMMLTDTELEAAEDEPIEFFKAATEGVNAESRRGAAVHFLNKLSIRFENQVTAIIGPTITQVLEVYTKDPASNWRQMDAVYAVVVATCAKTGTQRHGATSVNTIINLDDFCQQVAFKDLETSVHPVLVADALNFMVLFRNQLSSSVVVDFFRRQFTAKYLDPSAQPVCVLFSSYTVERLLTVSYVYEERHSISDFLLEMCQKLTYWMRQRLGRDCGYIMKCIYRCMICLDANLGGLVIDFTNFVNELIDIALLRHVYIDSIVLNFAFEMISLFIRNWNTLPGEGNRYYYKEVIPIITKIITSENSDFVPYAAQLAAFIFKEYAMFRGMPNSEAMVSDFRGMYTQLFRQDLWEAGDSCCAIAIMISHAIEYFPEVALSDEYPVAVYNLILRFLRSNVSSKFGFLLLYDLFPYVNKPGFPLTVQNVWTPMLERLNGDQRKSAEFNREFFVFVMRFIVYFSIDGLKSGLEEIQASLFDMLLNYVSKYDDFSLPYRITTEQRRSAIIGLATLLEAYNYPEDVREKFSVLLVALADASRVFKANASATEDAAESRLNDEKFNKLKGIDRDRRYDELNVDYESILPAVVKKHIGANPKVVVEKKLNNSAWQYLVQLGQKAGVIF